MQIPRNSILLCAEFVLGASTDDTARAAAQVVLAYLDTLSWLEPAPKPEPASIAPRPGQVWQKLNVGTKTARSAPRITIDKIIGANVFGWVGHEYERMRIATLQRDWHCLNPEI